MPGSALARAREKSLPRSHVGDIQRSRLLDGAVGAIDELGYGLATVGRIAARARVSRRTFYSMFADREECLAAVLEEVVGLIEAELATAGLDGLTWRERVREGLWGILSFFDREPALARVCVVQALRAGPVVLERRDALLARLAAVVDEGRLESGRAGECGPLTAEGVVGAAFTIVHRRLLHRDSEPLTGLLGELMGIVVLPYLGRAAARREQTRRAPAKSAVAPDTASSVPRGTGDPLDGVNLRVTYRTLRVLEGVAELSGRGSQPSNRQVATYAGIVDPGQISKLLRRLEDRGLLVNSGEGRHVKGEPNAWALTPKGKHLTHSIRSHTAHAREAA